MTGGLVVVGASLAGLRAVEGARKAGFSGPITVIGSEEHLPYDRPPLSKAYLEADGVAQTPTFRSEDVLRDELGVHLMLGASATGLDTQARVVEVDGRSVRYDMAVIATGVRPRRLAGADGLAGVHVLRTIDDAAALRTELRPGARVVVAGAGFIGSEVASSARKRGAEVVIVEAQKVPLTRAIGGHMGEVLVDLHRRNGVGVLCGSGVAGVEGEGRVERVRLTDGTVLDADVVVAGMGADPAVDWLAGSGLTLGDGIECDSTLFTGAPGVYAAGDVVRWHNPQFDRPMRLEHWTSAAEQGAAAARNALNPDAAKPYSTVPYFWSDWHGVRIQFVGLPQCDEVCVVEPYEPGGRGVALYRDGDRLIGALTIDGQSLIMKFRGMIMKGRSFAEAVEFARIRAGVTSVA